MKKTLLFAMTGFLCLGAFGQVIKIPVRGKHHTYSHRGPFVSKRTGHKTSRLTEINNFPAIQAKQAVRKKPV